jgi:hypothetical protein
MASKRTPAKTSGALPGWPEFHPVLVACDDPGKLRQWLSLELRTTKRAHIVKRIVARMRAVDYQRTVAWLRDTHGVKL